MKYLLVDTANTFFRARYISGRHSTLDERTGMAIHITLTSISKLWREQDPEHVVFCLEGTSWRRGTYPPYKKNRDVAKVALTPAEVKEDQAYWDAFNQLSEYLNNKTNCSVLHSPNAEADDLIARFIALHPHDEHVILSSDSDMLQLIAENVTVYNGITGELHSLKGVFNGGSKPAIDKKTKLPKEAPNPAWLLFEKCMRGDSSDNVFSAYPRVNVKRLKEAFNDREKKGYSWNNVMLQRWTDHNKKEHKVVDDYERNKVLIDLTAQPDKIKKEIDTDIISQLNRKTISQVGTHFIVFCGKHELVKLLDFTDSYVSILNRPYKVK